eukprot:360359-Chlamydomonas_euryale.AAC.6
MPTLPTPSAALPPTQPHKRSTIPATQPPCHLPQENAQKSTQPASPRHPHATQPTNRRPAAHRCMHAHQCAHRGVERRVAKRQRLPGALNHRQAPPVARAIYAPTVGLARQGRGRLEAGSTRVFKRIRPHCALWFHTYDLQVSQEVVCSLAQVIQSTSPLANPANSHSGNQAGRQPGRQAGKQAGRQTGRQAGRQAATQASSQTNKQAGTHALKH